MLKKNLTIIVLLLSTILLAIIVLFTAIKLRQPGPVAPTVPQRKPKAVEKPQPSAECQTTFRVIVGPTNTPGPSPTITLTPTPYTTDCYTQCDTDVSCTHSLVCREMSPGVKLCVNPDCPNERNCWCPGPTSPPPPPTLTPIIQPTPTPVVYLPTGTLIPTATPTPVTIPPVGIVENTFLALIAGFAFITIALLFAF